MQGAPRSSEATARIAMRASVPADSSRRPGTAGRRDRATPEEQQHTRTQMMLRTTARVATTSRRVDAHGRSGRRTARARATHVAAPAVGIRARTAGRAAQGARGGRRGSCVSAGAPRSLGAAPQHRTRGALPRVCPAVVACVRASVQDLPCARARGRRMSARAPRVRGVECRARAIRVAYAYRGRPGAARASPRGQACPQKRPRRALRRCALRKSPLGERARCAPPSPGHWHRPIRRDAASSAKWAIIAICRARAWQRAEPRSCCNIAPATSKSVARLASSHTVGNDVRA